MKIFLLFYDRARAQRRRLHSIKLFASFRIRRNLYMYAQHADKILRTSWCGKYLRAWLIQIGLKNVCDRYLSACNYIYLGRLHIYVALRHGKKSPGPREAINRETKSVPHALFETIWGEYAMNYILCRSTVDKRYKWPFAKKYKYLRNSGIPLKLYELSIYGCVRLSIDRILNVIYLVSTAQNQIKWLRSVRTPSRLPLGYVVFYDCKSKQTVYFSSEYNTILQTEVKPNYYNIGRRGLTNSELLFLHNIWCRHHSINYIY